MQYNDTHFGNCPVDNAMLSDTTYPSSPQDPYVDRCEDDEPLRFILPMVTQEQRAHLIVVLARDANRTDDVRTRELVALLSELA